MKVVCGSQKIKRLPHIFIDLDKAYIIDYYNYKLVTRKILTYKILTRNVLKCYMLGVGLYNNC